MITGCDKFIIYQQNYIQLCICKLFIASRNAQYCFISVGFMSHRNAFVNFRHKDW